MQQPSTGMYSHSTGPLDSPSFSYMRPGGNPSGNGAYQNSGPHSAYPRLNTPVNHHNPHHQQQHHHHHARDNFSGYGGGESMRTSHGGNAPSGHSRYATMGSMRGSSANTYSSSGGGGGFDHHSTTTGRGSGGGGGFGSGGLSSGANAISIGTPRTMGASAAHSGSRMASSTLLSGSAGAGAVKRPW